MRISDWSSDVCSSDLGLAGGAAVPRGAICPGWSRRQHLNPLCQAAARQPRPLRIEGKPLISERIDTSSEEDHYKMQPLNGRPAADHKTNLAQYLLPLLLTKIPFNYP